MVWLRSALVLLAPACAAVLLGRPSARPRVVAFGATFAAMLVVFVLFHLGVYGTLAPIPEHDVDLAGVLPSLATSLFEPGRGIALNTPALLLGFLALLGLGVAGAREHLRTTLSLLCVAAYLVPCCLYRQTGGVGGWSPAGRFWVALAPVVAHALLEDGRFVSALRSKRWLRRSLATTLVLSAITLLVCDLVPRVAFSAGQHWLARLGG
jgi:hypothetical protein